MNSIPRQLRRASCLVRRMVVDQLTGQRRKFAAERDPIEAGSFSENISVSHAVLASESVDAKLHNIRLANQRLSRVLVRPGEIFSFWHVVGAPTARRGFQPGRSLLGGELQLDYGGGLCQLAGLIYYASLVAGLDVIERHPHTVDIYYGSQRYAPLGADASVAFGFKDLRIINTHTAPITYRVSLSSSEITCVVASAKPFPTNVIEFEVMEDAATHAVVQTWRSSPASGTRESLGFSRYKRCVSPARETWF